MLEPKVRKIDFQFDDDIAFQWNPGNPYWGNFVNYASVIAPAFERYFIRNTRRAMPRIHDEKTQKMAAAFCGQEAQHAKHHRAHLNLLIGQYPGLEAVQQAVEKSYQTLYDEESLAFGLAYAAVVELCFGPFAKYVINHRKHLFINSDTRIASFILWHLVEEFEHRSAAIDIYNAVEGSYIYRLKTSIRVFKHLYQIDQIVREGFKRCVPVSPGEVGPSESLQFARTVPPLRTAGFIVELLSTFLPGHNVDNIRQPAWATQWFLDEAAGRDMRAYYSGDD